MKLLGMRKDKPTRGTLVAGASKNHAPAKEKSNGGTAFKGRKTQLVEKAPHTFFTICLVSVPVLFNSTKREDAVQPKGHERALTDPEEPSQNCNCTREHDFKWNPPHFLCFPVSFYPPRWYSRNKSLTIYGSPGLS